MHQRVRRRFERCRQFPCGKFRRSAEPEQEWYFRGQTAGFNFREAAFVVADRQRFGQTRRQRGSQRGQPASIQLHSLQPRFKQSCYLLRNLLARSTMKTARHQRMLKHKMYHVTNQSPARHRRQWNFSVAAVAL